MAAKKKTQKGDVRRQKQKVVKNNPNSTWLWISLGIMVALLVGFVLVKPSITSAREISVTQAYEKYQQQVWVLDVREIDEWNQGHIPGSTHVPLGELAYRLDEIPRDREIMVICRSGNRSLEAVNLLQDAGYNLAVSISGGLNAWSSSGYPVVQGPP